jgi:transcriptional regulator with XRE-family HTH domain
VFAFVGFSEDSGMPARKPESCPRRKRLGKNIAALRARRRLTQEELAEKAGVSSRYMQSLEAGEYFPSLPTLAHLRAVLRCDWNELFSGCER